MWHLSANPKWWRKTYHPKSGHILKLAPLLHALAQFLNSQLIPSVSKSLFQVSLPEMYQVPLYCCMLAPYNCRCRNRAFVLINSCSHDCSQPSSCTTRCATLYLALRADLLELAGVMHWTESIPIWLDQCHFPVTAGLDSTSWKNADVQLHTLVIGLPFGKPFLLTFWHSSSWTQWSEIIQTLGTGSAI